jgi:uncharacterized protein
MARTAVRRILCSVILLATCASPALAGPSFDCARATTRVERLICASPELGKLDLEMAELYERQLRYAYPWFSTVQRKWLARRGKCSDAACLATLYREHNKALESLHDDDWSADMAYRELLDVARQPDHVKAAHKAWHASLASCADLECALDAYPQRIEALTNMLKTIPRAGISHYENKELGIAFELRANRSVVPCDEPRCVQLIGPAMTEGSSSLLTFTVIDAPLQKAAATLWEEREGKWLGSGRNSTDVEATPYRGRGKGLQMTVDCGFSDRLGMHAAGECSTYLISNGKRSVAIANDGASGKDASSEATLASLRLLR